ncbi:hypothetical protein V7O66_11685 [Methanolobus sp. ZRKC3]|uniref:DUF7266 family protein n=1 Tax=Methanolobus sp. ZRKC3 TaxID=3125786 RepID=UPI00325503F3
MILKFVDDNRAVSLSVGFIMTFGITAITMIVVVSSFYGMMDGAEQTTMRNEFEIHGNDIALQISNIDTTVQLTENLGGKIESICYSPPLPDEIAGQQYSVEFSNQTREIIFESHGKDATRVKIPYSTTVTDVASVKLYSGSSEFRMHYDPTSRLIKME